MVGGLRYEGGTGAVLAMGEGGIIFLFTHRMYIFFVQTARDVI